MRLGELLNSPVVDSHGAAVGAVHDVRLVQDGPLLEGFGAALRIDALIIGTGSVAVRLGYHRHRVKGPLLLSWLFTTLEKRARYVPWDKVDHWDGKTVALSCPADELSNLEQAY